MNGSTRACVSILNVFGLFALVVGVFATVVAFVNSNDSLFAAFFEAAPGLGAVLSGSLLIGASEALRLLSEIRDSLAASRTMPGVRRAA